MQQYASHHHSHLQIFLHHDDWISPQTSLKVDNAWQIHRLAALSKTSGVYAAFLTLLRTVFHLPSTEYQFTMAPRGYACKQHDLVKVHSALTISWEMLKSLQTNEIHINEHTVETVTVHWKPASIFRTSILSALSKQLAASNNRWRCKPYTGEAVLCVLGSLTSEAGHSIITESICSLLYMRWAITVLFASILMPECTLTSTKSFIKEQNATILWWSKH